MTKIRLFIALCFVCSLAACSPENEVQMPTNQMPFFDVKGYFAEEIDRLNQIKKQSPYQKNTEVNGAKESTELDSLNFSDELAAFVNSDINRVSWFEKYTADSTYNVDGDLEKVNYQTEDKKLKIKQLEVIFNRTKVEKITIRQGGESLIATADKTLIYEPKRGYSIRSQQAVAMTGDNAYFVEVKF